jgi:hemerythrin superfamily protein
LAAAIGCNVLGASPTPKERTLDAIELLMQQHRETEQLFERFEETDRDDEQLELARTAISELRLHTTIEEEIFYPAIRQLGGELEEHVLEDLEEHHAVEVLLDELEGMTPSDERFVAKFTVISELVLHHVEEEEQEQFPQVREQMDEGRLVELGQQMLERYEELKSGEGLEDATKEDLYQQAREKGIEGRSGMSKRELADALRSGS